MNGSGSLRGRAVAGQPPVQPGAAGGSNAGTVPNLLEFLPLVRSIASRIYATIPPYASVDLSDLVQSGHLGLLNAARAYRSGTQVPFGVYARFRIRGEILDSLRQIDVASRSLRRFERRIRNARHELVAQMNREPTEAELSTLLKIDSETLAGKRKTLKAICMPVNLVEIENQEDQIANWRAPEPSPETLRAENEARDLLDEAMRTLPERSREIIHLYYRGGWTMREIGERFQVNESRVSQIHRSALERIARHLKSQGVDSGRHI
jgi:RNA polymerase sigma factor for flagellar operon FliA